MPRNGTTFVLGVVKATALVEYSVGPAWLAAAGMQELEGMSHHEKEKSDSVEEEEGRASERQ